MKMLKKAAAVLLAAAMSLVMLTACGGGSSSVAKTDAQKMEDAYIAVFSTVLGKECTNDSGLKEQAKTAFNANVAEDNSVKTVMGNISTSETEISMFEYRPQPNTNVYIVRIDGKYFASVKYYGGGYHGIKQIAQ